MTNPAVPQVTLGTVVNEVAKRAGVWINQGTSTAGSTTSLTDATNERTPVAEATAVTGTFLYGRSGTGAGQVAEISTYATIGVMGWTATLTSPAADTGWTRLAINPQIILDAIADATRDAIFRQCVPYRSTSLVTNSLLMCYGDFEEWASGASSAPDGFVLSGAGATVAREGTITRHGNYSADITTAGAIGALTYTVPTRLLPRLRGQSLTLEGYIAGLVAGQATIRVAATDKGNNVTNTNRVLTYTDIVFEDLRDISSSGIAMPDPVTALTVSFRAIAGASNTYADDLMLLGPDLYEYDLPAGTVAASGSTPASSIVGIDTPIMMEDAFRSGKYTIQTPPWHILLVDNATSTARQIQFSGRMPSGRHLQMLMWQAPTIQSSATGNVDPHPSWLIPAAAMRVLEIMPATKETELRYQRQERALAALPPYVKDLTFGHRVIRTEAR